MSVQPEHDPPALLALARVTEPGSRPVARAVEALGAQAVWQALRTGRPCASLSPELRSAAAARAVGYDPGSDLDRLRRAGGRLLFPGHPEWPAARLSWLDGTLQDAPPLALCVRGPHDLAQVTQRSAAVVGARAATAYGAHVAGELARALADRGVAVVSGGAYGIDAAAHRGALAAQAAPTVAVLACGVDIAYPRGNDRLLSTIAEHGLVVSELAPGSTPTRGRFLVRNRLIAALTLGTVVVEAALRSGSLATADRARDLQRHVMAVPGPVTSALSAGCHQLLRRGGVCVTGVEEVLDLIGVLGADGAESPRGPTSPRDELSETVRRVLDAVPVRGGAGEAVLARDAGVSTLVVQQVLPPLQVHGLVERTSQGWRLTPLGAGRPAPARSPHGAAPLRSPHGAAPLRSPQVPAPPRPPHVPPPVPGAAAGAGPSPADLPARRRTSMTRPMPNEPHDGIKADAGPEVQASEREQGPALSRAGSSGTLTTGTAPGDEQPSQAKDTGTAGGDVLSGVTATAQDSEDAVSGDTGPEHPGTRS